MTNPTPPLESLHDTASELLEGYVLGALQPAEAAVVDEHLDEGCEDCEENVGVLVRIAQSLPLASRLATPAGDLKTRVLAAVAAGDVGGVDDDAAPAITRRERRPIPIWSARRFQAVAAAIGLVAIGGLLAWAIVLQSEVDNLQGENVALSAMVDSSAERLDGNMATALFSLAGENSSSLQFVANETNRGAAARMLWDADEDTVVLAALGLEPTGDGGVYVTGPRCRTARRSS